MVRIAMVALALAAGCRTAAAPAPRPPAPISNPAGDLEALRAEIAAMEAKSARLTQQALELFARGEYPAAEALHREAFAISREAEKARKREEGLIRETVRRRVADLDHEDIAIREAATKALVELGAAAARVLPEFEEGLPPEALRRLKQVMMTIGESQWTRQWASEARASTQYRDQEWSAARATGPPDTPEGGDCTTAWAPKEQDADTEWLELNYAKAVHPGLIRIHETYNAGAVTKIEARDPAGEWRVLWEGPAAVAETPRWFEVKVLDPGWPSREIRIMLDSDAVPGWNEIDAVELLGSPAGAPAGAKEGRRPGEESRR